MSRSPPPSLETPFSLNSMVDNRPDSDKTVAACEGERCHVSRCILPDCIAPSQCGRQFDCLARQIYAR